jgi:alpha-L-glutamate ligase-like protein
MSRMRLREAVRRLRRDALGMNRRNLEFLVPYNPPALFAVVDYKPGTKACLAAAGIPVPATYAELARQWDLRRLGAILAGRSAFVVKPARGAGGGGVIVVAEWTGDALVKASGVVITLADLAAHCSDILAGAYASSTHSDEVLIEYRVRADPVLGGISYRGVPDVRVLVFRGVPVQAMVRLPTRASDGRANLHMGGMAVGIDLATGITTHGVLGGRPAATHPDLDCVVGGRRIPHWEAMLRIAARCYDAIPLGYLGVDLVLDADLGPLVLELNARPGLTIQVANRRGLRPAMEALVAADLMGASVDERLALAHRLADPASTDARRGSVASPRRP